MVNYAGFGLITDLRNRLYQSILHRSVGFFSGTPPALWFPRWINDWRRCNSRFLRDGRVPATVLHLDLYRDGGGAAGRTSGLVLVLFVPFVIFSAGRIGRRSAALRAKARTSWRTSRIFAWSIAGNRIVKAFTMERWESLRFFDAAGTFLKPTCARCVRRRSALP